MLGRVIAAGLVFLALALAGPAPASVTGWLTFGNDDSRIGFVPEGVADPTALREIWAAHLDGRITTQILVVRDVPQPGQLTLYVGTSKGVLYALNENGFERAHRQLGFMRLKNCEFLPDGPAYDARTDSLLVATGDAYLYGKNRGKSFTESAGLAEHVVQLTRNLKVLGAHTPLDYREPAMRTSPARRSSCGRPVAPPS